MTATIAEPIQEHAYGVVDAARAADDFRARFRDDGDGDAYVIPSVEAPSAYLDADDPDALAEAAADTLDAAIAAIEAGPGRPGGSRATRRRHA